MSEQKDSDGSQEQGGKSGKFPVGIIGAVAIAALAAGYYWVSGGQLQAGTSTERKPAVNYENVPYSLHGNWRADAPYKESTGEVRCDFPRYSLDEIKKDNSGDVLEAPFILTGMQKPWPARLKWQHDEFVQNYGERLVQIGSESSIVYAGGQAADIKTLSSLIEEFRSNASIGDAFAFDVSAFKTIPELSSDFTVPEMFRSWDNSEKENTSFSWHMLSLGPSQSGLPFHSHGKTWLGLVFGEKRWFAYPPGYGPPPQTYGMISPLRPVLDWVNIVYPTLQQLPSPPLRTLASENAPTGQYYKPLECLLQGGEIMYLPDGWSHMTLNIGEAVAVGGQAALPATERLKLSRRALELSPDNFEALKGAGLALAHLGLAELDDKRNGLKLSAKGVIKLDAKNFDRLVLDSEDVWMVQFFSKKYPKGTASESSALMSQTGLVTPQEFNLLWGDLSASLKHKINFAAMDVTNLSFEKLYTLFGIDKDVIERDGVIVRRYDNSSGTGALSAIKELRSRRGRLFQRGNDRENPADTSLDADPSAETYIPNWDFSELPKDKVLEVTRVMRMFALGVGVGGFESNLEVERGTIHTVPSSARRSFEQSEVYLRKALAVYPLHPETNGILGEVVGTLHGKVELVAYAQSVEKIFDEMDRTGVSDRALASVYHKLGSLLLHSEKALESLPFLEKSLNIFGRYVPALVDFSHAGMLTHNIRSAKRHLELLKTVCPSHPAIRQLQTLLVEKMKSALDIQKEKEAAAKAAAEAAAAKKNATGGGESSGDGAEEGKKKKKKKKKAKKQP